MVDAPLVSSGERYVVVHLAENRVFVFDGGAVRATHDDSVARKIVLAEFKLVIHEAA